jgi:D-cysteine desulfhydrase
VEPGPFELVDARGPGFGIASEAGERAAAIALRTEGLLLDPVYTAKAFAVVLDLIDAGAGSIVFWHTGGLLAAADHMAGLLAAAAADDTGGLLAAAHLERER